MSAKVEALEAAGKAQSELAERLSALEARLEERQHMAVPPPEGAAEAVPHHHAAGPGWGSILGGLVLALVLPLLALLMAHWLVVMVLDLKTWVIRLASLLLPLPFALWAPIQGRHRLAAQVMIALVLGLAAVLGMSAITGLMDNQPILPQDSRDWREVIEYAVSMALSYVTGAFIAHLLRPRRGGDKATDGVIRRLARDLAKLTAPDNETRQHLESRIQTLAGTIGMVVPIVTGAVSIISGMRKLWE